MPPIGTAAGYPQYSGGVIPSSVRAGKVLMAFYMATVFGAIANTDYEGDIKGGGDKVEIVGEPDVTIRDYVKGQGLEIEALDVPVQYLQIDQAGYWAFKLDSIDKFQSDHNYMDLWSVIAGKKMKIKTDKTVLAGIYTQAAAGNSGATAGKISQNINLGSTGAPLAITKSNVLQFIAECGQVLDEQDVPDEDRKLTLPAWMTKLIKISEFKDATVAGDNTSVLRNGRLGIIDRFTIYQSNNIAVTVDGADRTFEVIANHKSAISFAAQIEEIKAQDLGEKGFGSFAKGLFVYGFKVLQPEALVHAHVKQG